MEKIDLKNLDEFASFSVSSEIFLLIGVFLASAIFVLSIYFGLNKKRTYLHFFLYLLFSARSFYNLLMAQSLLFLLSFLLSNLFLLSFFITFFKVRYSKIILIFLLLLFVLIALFIEPLLTQSTTIIFMAAWSFYAITLMASSLIALRAVKNNGSSAQLISIITALIFLFNILLISDSFFIDSIGISSFFLILAVMYIVFSDIKAQQVLVKSLKIRAVELENEMLKKSIQPHFLLNTLTILS